MRHGSDGRRRYDGMDSDGSSMPKFLVASNYFFTASLWGHERKLDKFSRWIPQERTNSWLRIICDCL